MSRSLPSRGHDHSDLSVGADVMVAARIAAVVFLQLFAFWVDVPHRGWVELLLVGVVAGHLAFWALVVRRGRITPASAVLTLLTDTIGVGIAMFMTGGPDSPVILIWGPNVAVAAIWLGVRRSLPVLAAASVFLLVGGVVDPWKDVPVTRLQHAVFATFMLVLIVAHGGIVAARQRRHLGALAAAEAQSRRDPLTGLGNRAAFDEQLPIEIDRAARYGHPLSLVVIDLDDFKAVNDTRGHLAGDDVLVDVAEQMRREMRRSDIAVRLGGEEFVIVMPETGGDDAVALADRLRRRVASSAASAGVTLSAGVATFPSVSQDPQELLELADRAMYAAKRAGKNRTERAVPPDVANAPADDLSR